MRSAIREEVVREHLDQIGPAAHGGVSVAAARPVEAGARVEGGALTRRRVAWRKRVALSSQRRAGSRWAARR